MSITQPQEAENADKTYSRPRRTDRKMPARYRDETPKAQAGLPYMVPASELAPISPPKRVSQDGSVLQKIKSKIRNILDSPRNSFGLFRRYRGTSFPPHDPESDINVTDLCDISNDHDKHEEKDVSASELGPYPNRSSFLLGDWYWTGGIQKTKRSFKKLVSIICRSDFKPADLEHVRWDTIDKELGDDSPNEDDTDTWFGELDAGWIETQVSISVPFHRSLQSPGTRIYSIPNFRHRSITSILKEKMANPEDFQSFHLEPYELRWQKLGVADSSERVYGELYTSPAFLEAYEDIQISPGEPGCNLPRVVVGLMFSSDSTQLTSFGNSSLWPCYLYFGNESKYRRCKPSSNLCNHLAYFQKVCENL